MGTAVSHFNLRTFQTLRIACGHRDCRAVTELPASKVEAVMKKTNASCPVCGQPFTKPDVEDGADVVTQFARVVLALSPLDGNVTVELLVPAGP